MRRWLLLALLMLGLPLDSSAQIIPHVAVFGGYTYIHAKYNTGVGGFSLNGWDGSLEVKPLPLVGLVADVSRQYASPTQIASAGSVKENQTTLLLGPEVSIPHIPRVIPFAHAMVGIIHGTNTVTYISPATGSPCTPTSCPPAAFRSLQTGNAFATALGGGVDIKLAGPLWFRAVQADWLHANLSPDHHTQVRLATGLVVRFGR